MDVARSAPCGRYLLAPQNGNKEGSKCLMVLRVKHAPTRLPTNSLYPDGQHTLAFYIKRVPPVGQLWCCHGLSSAVFESHILFGLKIPGRVGQLIFLLFFDLVNTL